MKLNGWLFNLSFWVLAVVTVGSALLVANLKNLARAAVFLVFFFLGVAGFYFLLEAQFLALVQVMVYAGAVAVLFAFVVMLTPGLPGMQARQSLNRAWGIVLSLVFLLVLAGALRQMPGAGSAPSGAAGVDLAMLGRELLGKYLLPFELVSVILLVALVGAVLYTVRGREGGAGHDGAE